LYHGLELRELPDLEIEEEVLRLVTHETSRSGREQRSDWAGIQGSSRSKREQRK
jgi:hypothetical protein